MAIPVVGDLHTTIVVDLGTDVSGAVEAIIYAKKPNGELVSWNATPGSTSITYITQQGDFDIPGKWIIQPYVDLSTWRGRGAQVEMIVESRLS